MAIHNYRRAIARDAEFFRVNNNLSNALKEAGKVHETIDCCHCVCDWDNQEEMFIKVEGILRREIEVSFIPSVQPLQATAYPLDSMFSLDISRKHAEYFSVIAACYSFSPFTHPPPLLIKSPIQVSYLGFPGTTGATYIDYLVTDKFVSPMKYAHFYSKKLVHLPHCYFVNDYKQENCDVLYPYCQPKRSDYGLPEDKFLFTCFNQLCKMDPEIVRI
ncbi:hypothetical protein CQW23_08496 [Capsicum baccatum]|uniref:O-GlcNAc transferase C-terminal domain-containing protein n=1 Tax=Capsicum baccatum TaxID=33114 RepID=A0A2G2X939_CAPBA|nr:hypothetical protein CQW23_08496 [Capsicum baccatum]